VVERAADRRELLVPGALDRVDGKGPLERPGARRGRSDVRRVGSNGNEVDVRVARSPSRDTLDEGRVLVGRHRVFVPGNHHLSGPGVAVAAVRGLVAHLAGGRLEAVAAVLTRSDGEEPRQAHGSDVAGVCALEAVAWSPAGDADDQRAGRAEALDDAARVAPRAEQPDRIVEVRLAEDPGCVPGSGEVGRIDVDHDQRPSRRGVCLLKAENVLQYVVRAPKTALVD
jgi:hypothetical protein